jgi:SOS response regulatory protein OraA/RecX
MSKNTLQNIRGLAIYYLQKRDHSVYELKIKLQRKYPDNEENIKSILKECEEKKWLNDSDFAQQYIQYRQETSPRGKFALQKELYQKGIAPDIISGLLANMTENNERTFARKLALKKLNAFPSRIENKKKKEKLFRFLQSRGFGIQVIWDVLSEILDSHEENT